jgi:hypothetical protein
VTTKVRFLDADDKILPDMSARVAFLSQAVDDSQQKAVLAVSPQAIVERDGKSQVFTVGADGRAHAVVVKPGATLGAVREVSGDLKAGDTLVLDASKISDGRKLKLAGAR